jgi:hypothetical protein
VPWRWLQVQEPEEEDAVYLRRQQAAVDEINKRGLTLFHASVQARLTAPPHAGSGLEHSWQLRRAAAGVWPACDMGLPPGRLGMMASCK